MRCAILAFAAGAAWLQLQPTLPSAIALLAWAAAALMACLLGGHARALAAGLLLGVCWSTAVAHLALGHALPRQDEGRDLTISGVVASLPHRFDGGARFHFDVEQVETRGASVPPRIILSWYGATASDPAAIHPGERWRLVVRLQRPHGNANPHLSICRRKCSICRFRLGFHARITRIIL